MSQAHTSEAKGGVPTFQQRHRLALALEYAGVDRDEIADVLGVHRNTVGNYLRGDTEPGRAVLRVWAMRCGVPYVWITTGETPRDNPDGPPSTIWYSRNSRSRAA